VSRFVLDSSVSTAWCFEDETSTYTDSVLDALTSSRAFVPALWRLEVAQVLALCERKGRISMADATRFLAFLDSLPISIDEQTAQNAFGEIFNLARTHQLTTYHAAYLELAIRQGCALATLDDDLRRAAARSGAAVFEG